MGDRLLLRHGRWPAPGGRLVGLSRWHVPAPAVPCSHRRHGLLHPAPARVPVCNNTPVPQATSSIRGGRPRRDGRRCSATTSIMASASASVLLVNVRQRTLHLHLRDHSPLLRERLLQGACKHLVPK